MKRIQTIAFITISCTISVLPAQSTSLIKISATGDSFWPIGIASTVRSLAAKYNPSPKKGDPGAIHYKPRLPLPPVGTGAYGGNFGGNDQCKGLDTPLTALVPMNKQKASLLAFTAEQSPTFWFYIPYTTKLSAELILKDENGSTVIPVQLSGKTGLIGIPLPPSKPLLLDKDYSGSQPGEVRVNRLD